MASQFTISLRKIPNSVRYAKSAQLTAALKQFGQAKLMSSDQAVNRPPFLLTLSARCEGGTPLAPQQLIDPYNSLPVASEPKPYQTKEALRKQKRNEFVNLGSWYLRVPINIGRTLAMIYRGTPIVNQPAVPKYNIGSEQNALLRFVKGMYNIGRWFIKDLVESFRQDYRDFINLFRNK